MSAPRTHIKRQTDLQIISDWIEPGDRVLDIGCGRGVLLEHLQQTKSTYGVGVDTALDKVQSCVKRGVNVFQGDAEDFMATFPDGSFDWVVLSRTVQELERPADTLKAALRVGRRVAVGFVNHGYWLNRWAMLRTGNRVQNEVFPQSWDTGSPYHLVTIDLFEEYCARENIQLEHRIYLRGDWKTPCHRFPNLRAGYALYALRG